MRSQGQDYYYTLQGWIKGVNQPYGDQNAYNNNLGKDVYAYALGYYENDYKPINSSLTTTDTRDQLWTRLNESHNHKGLYNGNISWMVTDLTKIGEVTNDRSKGIQAMLYKYDQLHRITKSRSLTQYAEGTGFAARTATSTPKTLCALREILRVLCVKSTSHTAKLLYSKVRISHTFHS